MAILTQEMKNVIKVIGKGGAVVHLTTVSKEGKPNIVAERFVATFKDEYIIVADMFAQKTKVNLNENPVGSISIAYPVGEHAWVFSGPATIISHAAPDDFAWYGVNAGELLTEWGDWATKEPPDEVPPDIAPQKLAQRGVIVVKVENIYSFEAENAGEKIEGDKA